MAGGEALARVEEASCGAAEEHSRCLGPAFVPPARPGTARPLPGDADPQSASSRTADQIRKAPASAGEQGRTAEEPATAPGTSAAAVIGLGVFLWTLIAGVSAGPVWGAQTLTPSGPAPGMDLGGVWAKAADSAAKGGIAGSIAGALQVLSFMWLRTSMNYQYFNGGTLQSALSTLWEAGGIRRLYQGVSLALVQAPLSRFGDTAANAGVLILMDFYLPDLPLPVKTAAASTAAATWRLLLTPIDTLKTVRQVRGEEAMDVLLERVKRRGVTELYSGAIANFAANWVGNFPYFVVFNGLGELWPTPDDAVQRIVRNGVRGMCSSVASDVASNSLRVLKTIRQSSDDPDLGYVESARRILDKDGFLGLFGRGLETRLLVNVLQGTFFTILWKLIEEALSQPPQ
mmetsp:Transcript_67354/g.208374  ORF Transcript_67354/g.208374 Transcript_67354/m.208374 type:complete len:402 (-) Transcript_67354:75-1280(-)